MKMLRICTWMTCALFAACTTPPEIKQALVAKDSAYAENARLMNIHRELLVNIDMRYWYWYRYAKKLALLDNALKWATTDPDPPEKLVERLAKGGMPIEKAREQARLMHATAVKLELGNPDALLKVINTIRLKDLPERKDKDGIVAFQKGQGDMNNLVLGIPDLIQVIQENVEAEYQEENKATDYSAFDDYQTNLAALRRINGMIKRYLDIDVTVKQDDIQQLAESVKALR
jgi:hypothetical protein